MRENLPKHLRGCAIGVGDWVEIVEDDIPDLCTCGTFTLDQRSERLNDKKVRDRTRRIAACWNLCSGLPTELLEQLMLNEIALREIVKAKVTTQESRAV